MHEHLEDPAIVRELKTHFAPDGAAEREHNARSATLGFGTIHYSLVINLKPRRLLVIGSRHGYIPAAIAIGLRVLGAGSLDFVDANYSDAEHGFGAAYGGVSHWTEAPEEHFASLGLGDRLRVHIMRSAQFFASCDATYDYVYLDGDHSYEGCRFDFEESVKRAVDGAVIALHDVTVTDTGFGVGRFFEELDGSRFGKVLIGPWPGLGLVQIRKGG